MSRRSKKTYTDEEKIKYWRNKARKGGGTKRTYTKPYYSGKGSYNYNKGYKRNYSGGKYQKVGGNYGYQQPIIIKDDTTSMENFGGVGETVGGAIGKGLGMMIGKGVDFFTGKGDYKVKENVLLDGMLSGKEMPPIINPSEGGLTIRKSEYISDIFSSNTAGAFRLTNYYVNPGLSSTFQWLSQIAGNFDEWIAEGIYFEFRSMSSDSLNSTNTALGSVILSAQYNSTLPNFTNKQSMENYEGGISVKPSKSVRYFVECAKKENVLDNQYVRTGSVPSGQDQRFFDLCNFQVATVGCQGTNVNLGELWVCYQIGLRKPKLYQSLGESVLFYKSSFTAPDATHPLGTSFVAGTPNTLGITQTSEALVFPFNSLTKCYLLHIYWTGGTAAVNAFAGISGTSGMTLTQQDAVGFSVSTNRCSITYTVSIPGNLLVSGTPPTLTLEATSSVFPTNSPTGLVYITQIPNSFMGF